MPQARHMRDQPPADGGGRADWLLQRRQHGRSRADATAICGLVALLRLRRVRYAAARVCRHEPSGLAAASVASPALAAAAEPAALAAASVASPALAAAAAAALAAASVASPALAAASVASPALAAASEPAALSAASVSSPNLAPLAVAAAAIAFTRSHCPPGHHQVHARWHDQRF